MRLYKTITVSVFTLHVVAKKLILDHGVDVDSPANKEWFSVAMDMITLEGGGAAFRL